MKIATDTVKHPHLTQYPRNLATLMTLGVLLAACSSTPEETPALETGAQVAAHERNGKWLCTGTAQQSWDCRQQREGNSATDRPETSLTAEPATTETTIPAPTPARQTNVKPAPPTRSPIETQILAAPAGSVIVQLLAARSQATLERYKAEQPALPYEQVAIQRDGERWQLLFLGPYTDRRQAEDIVEALSPFPEPTWIRPVDSFRQWLTDQ